MNWGIHMTIKEKFIRDLTNELYKINERLKVNISET